MGRRVLVYACVCVLPAPAHLFTACTTHSKAALRVAPHAMERRCAPPTAPVGYARRFGGPFLGLVSTLASYFSAADLEFTYLWMGMLSANLHARDARDTTKQAIVRLRARVRCMCVCVCIPVWYVCVCVCPTGARMPAHLP